MFAILLIFILVIFMVCAGLYAFSKKKAHEDTYQVRALEALQKIDDPVQRSVAINDWMNRNIND